MRETAVKTPFHAANPLSASTSIPSMNGYNKL